MNVLLTNEGLSDYKFEEAFDDVLQSIAPLFPGEPWRGFND